MKSRKNCSDLSWEERQELYRLRNEGYGIREIARRLSRAPSTISVELARHRRERGWFALPWYEKARRAHDAASQRRGRPRRRDWGLKNEKIRRFVHTSLKDKLSPKSISFALPVSHPGERISHESIYQYIYNRERGLLKYLVRHGKTKRTGRASKQRSRMREAELSKKRVDKRPEPANARTQLGHYESDFIVSARGGKSCLLVLVDRKSRLVRLRKVASREADIARRTMFQLLHCLPSHARRSLTVDNDTAHVRLPNLEQVFRDDGFTVYWCNPYRAWERGTVEAVNGILRRWFPKGTSFDDISDQQIEYVERWFNRRPMNVLGGQSPAQVFEFELKAVA